LPELPIAASQATVEATDFLRPDDDVKHVLITISEKLLEHYDRSTMWKATDDDPDIVSLKTLNDRLYDGKLVLSPVKARNCDKVRIRAAVHHRISKLPHRRPLEDFEDLYYAALQKIKDMHQHIKLRIDNNFNQTADPLYVGGPSISEFEYLLFGCWAILNDTALVKTLDNAIQRSRVRSLHLDIVEKVRKKELNPDAANDLIADLYNLEEYENVPGLAWIGGWSAAMIGAWLQEKYRFVLEVEWEEEKRKE
ncbi:uncharacterized protein BDR25DRAFT_199528, partial [Lindgomyces ingoldianus]